jgi:hypothetical protein
MRNRAKFISPQLVAVAALVLVCGLLTSVFAQAQITRLNGTVKDPTGASVVGASVTLTDNATGTTKTTTTSDEGTFAFDELRGGIYSVSIETTGFKKTTIPDVQVNVDQTATVNVELEVGGVGETVTVSASDTQAVVNTENAQLKNTVLERQIQDLPLNGRNPLTLAGLQAGVNSSGSGTRTASVNGLRGTFTNLTWDGININDNFIRTDGFFGVAAPSVASVSEFTLTTQNAGASDGLGVAQLKLVTPRGGNEYHGQFFEFHRNDVFDANTFFNNAAGRFTSTDAQVIAGLRQAGELRNDKPKLIQNQFGFNIGGPMLVPHFGEGTPKLYGKDKLYFFFFYEGTRVAQDTSATRTFLTQSARNGDFSYVATCTASGANACPAGITPGQLVTVNLLTLSGRALDPITSGLANAAPVPNDPTTLDLANVAGGTARSNFGTFRFNSPQGSSSDLWGFRVDYDLNSRNRFEAIYNRFTFDFPNSAGEPFPGAPGDGQNSIRPRGSFAWNATPTNSLNNELRFGFNFYNVSFFTNEPFSRGYQIVQPLISDSEDNFLPQGRDVKTYDLIDNASWVRGDHVIRFGGNYRDNYISPYNDAGILPTVNIGFSGTGTPNPLTTGRFPGGISNNAFTQAGQVLAILTGPILNTTQTFNAASRTEGFVAGATQRQDFRYFNISAYAQDTWRFRRNLTLNFGLRYEFVSVPSERQGLVLLPTNRSMDVLRENAVLDFASGGDRRGFYNNDLNNFAPSFSFAWDPFDDGKTSLRGGYSISYVIDNNITTVLNAVRGNPGLTGSTRTLTGAAIANRTPGGLGGGVPTVTPPPFAVPRTVLQNITEFGGGSAFFTFEPEFKTPYVQQWNIGIEREIFNNTAFEIRYVGNRGTKLTRGIDYNQLRVGSNTAYLTDFIRAQGNLSAVIAERARISNDTTLTAAQRTALLTARPLTAAFNALIPGSQMLPYISRLGGGGLLDRADVQTNLATGQAGALAEFFAGANRAVFFPGGANNVPLSDFLPNTNTFVADAYINGANSWYHGLQTEVRRRLSSGLYFQANYTYSRGMTDYEGSQSNFAGLMDLSLGAAIEKQRSFNDVTHVFKANGVLELPFGPGKRFLNYGGALGKVFGGWSINGLTRWQSGEPVSIVSARGTLNRAGRSGLNTVNSTLSNQALQEQTGLFFDPVSGRPRLFDPTLIAAVRANPEDNAFLANPRTPGQVGNLQLTPVSGPSAFYLDMSVIKRTNITERMNVEFRAEAFNVLNHTVFDLTATQQLQNINSATFGQFTTTAPPRILQFAAKFNF